MGHRIAILGATGSIGQSTLDVLGALGEPWTVTALSCHGRPALLAPAIRRFRPSVVAVTDAGCDAAAAEAAVAGTTTRLLRGAEALVEIATRDDVDTVVAAVVGAAGLPAVLAAVKAGKRVALANKESLVIAGSLLMPLARKTGAEIIPVDSEHSAIFQAIACGRRQDIARAVLTASGGPFRTWPMDKIENASPAQALAHPTWSMGAKVTIDSATMFNKALELIEARWLFDLSPDQIGVMVHPESVIHSMVEFVDGSVVAQLSPPDMRLPIQYALTYPARTPGPARRMDWTKSSQLRLEPPDLERFASLRLAYQVARDGGTAGAVLNAANEVAVEAFLAGRIAFGGITRTVEATLDAHRSTDPGDLEGLLEADLRARQHAARHVSREREPVVGRL